MSDDLVKRLRDGCSCNIDSSPCMAEEECRDAYAAADRIEELEAQRKKTYEALLNVTRLHDEVEAKLSESEALLAKAVEALGRVMVGGNHLATILPNSFPPAETEPLIALEKMGYGYDFEAWCCWRSIMLARTTLAELTGGKDE